MSSEQVEFTIPKQVVIRSDDGTDYYINPRIAISKENEMKLVNPKPQLCSSFINDMYGDNFPEDVIIDVRFNSTVVRNFVDSVNGLHDLQELVKLPYPVSCEVEYPKKGQKVSELFIAHREYLKRENAYLMSSDHLEGTPMHQYFVMLENNPLLYSESLAISCYFGIDYITHALFLAFAEWRHLEFNYGERQNQFYQRIRDQDPENAEFNIDRYRTILNSIKDWFVTKYEGDEMKIPRVWRALNCEPDDPEEARLEREAEAAKKATEKPSEEDPENEDSDSENGDAVQNNPDEDEEDDEDEDEEDEYGASGSGTSRD